MAPVFRWRSWWGAVRGLYQSKDFSQLDAVSRWLYAGRFIILVISAQAAVIATLLAVPQPHANLWYAIPLLFGYIAVHAISNFSNDYFGYVYGHDTPDSPRARYTLHPLVHGVLTKRALFGGIAVLWAVTLGIGTFFFWVRGLPVVWLFAAGVAFLFLYDAAPKSLKAIGLGELAAFLVWGPLMIGGGYYCLTGEFSWPVMAASAPYGLGIATILIGKHLDKIAFDDKLHILTLPVLMGERASRIINQVAVAVMYLLVVGLVVCGWLSPWMLVVFLNVPAAWRLLKAAAAPRPATPPEGYVGWPLWMNRFNSRHNRRFGWLYILGLALSAAWGLVRPMLG